MSSFILSDIVLIFKAIDWDAEELDILVRTAVKGVMNHPESEASLPDVAQEALQTQGYKRSAEECQDQWHYMVTYCRLGGYCKYMNQINIIHYMQIHHDYDSSTDNNMSNREDSSDLWQSSTNHKLCTNNKVVNGKRKYSSSDKQGETDKSEDRSPVWNNRDDAVMTQKNSTKSITSMIKSLSVQPSKKNAKKDTFGKESSERSLERNGVSIEPTRKDPEKCKLSENSIDRALERIDLGNPDGKNISKGPEVEKVRVEVVSITEEGDRKVLTCVVREGTSTQLITLHFPVTHRVPANTRFIRVPFSTKTKGDEDSAAGIRVEKSASAVKGKTVIQRRQSVFQHSVNIRNGARNHLNLLRMGSLLQHRKAKKLYERNTLRVRSRVHTNNSTSGNIRIPLYTKQNCCSRVRKMQRIFSNSRTKLILPCQHHPLKKYQLVRATARDQQIQKKVLSYNGMRLQRKLKRLAASVDGLIDQYQRKCSEEREKLSNVYQENHKKESQMVYSLLALVNKVQEISSDRSGVSEQGLG